MIEAERRPLRVAYVSVGRADDVHEWSGLNAAIRASLIRQGCRLHDVDRLGTEYPLALRVRKKLHDSFLATTYALERSPVAASRWSRIADDRIAQLGPVDAVVSPGTLPVAFLETAAPLAIWGDATFHSLRATYPDYAAYSRASIVEGDRVERAALGRASLICYASEWAADDAAGYYGVTRNKIRVIPFGANCDPPYASAAEAAAAVAARDWSVARFAFIGVDWQRKGGDLAVAIVQRLNELGTRSVLTVVGCQPPAGVAGPNVECPGFLSKKSETDKARLDQILRASHFLLMPTTAECFGLVFAEASAYALPSVSRAVGGVPSAVLDGRTGRLLPADAGVDAYCAALQPLLQDRARYGAMCAAAYHDYATRLNWQVAGARFVDELREAVLGK
jgi:glycosyltransferase involved in cell wall biosynthesis